MLPHLSYNKKTTFYIILLIAFLVIFALIFFIYLSPKHTESSPELSPFYTPPLTDGATYDYLSPLQSMNIPNSESTIVCIGNGPFSDSKEHSSGLANQLAALTGATVYNCSIPNTYLSAYNETFKSNYPYDAFSFYWLTTAFCVNNTTIYDIAYDNLNPIPNEAKKSIELLFSIDFNTVDYLFVMYDGSDYLAARPSSNPENSTDIQSYAGSLAAGIELINATYPHINIIVLGPGYLAAYDDTCEYVDSMYQDYGQGNMPAYVSCAAITCATRNVTFIDNYFSTITKENAPQCLVDNLKLNDKGREAVINNLFERFTLFANP